MSRTLLAFIWIITLLSACGVTSQPPAQISFMVFGDPAERAAYQQLVDTFEQNNSQIDVNLIHIPSQSDYRKRLGVDFVAGKPADVMLLNYRRYANFAAKGVLEPLGPYLEKSNRINESDFYPQAIEPFRWNGALMCIPQNLSSLVVYYNKNLFDQAGVAYPSDDWTWDDFLTTAKALTKDLDGDGVIDQHGFGTEPLLFCVAPFIWQNGGDLVDNPDAPTRLTLDTPEARQALQWFMDLRLTHGVTPDAVQDRAELSESRFQNGRMAMYLNSRRGVPTYREITTFDWDVAPLPQGAQRAGILHADAYCMAGASAAKDAAWKFIEFANSVEGQTIIARSGRTVPSLKAVAESPVFLDPEAKPQRSRVFLDEIPHIKRVPIMDTWVDIEDTAGEELERAWYGQITLDEAIPIIDQRAREFFAR